MNFAWVGVVFGQFVGAELEVWSSPLGSPLYAAYNGLKFGAKHCVDLCGPVREEETRVGVERGFNGVAGLHAPCFEQLFEVLLLRDVEMLVVADDFASKEIVYVSFVGAVEFGEEGFLERCAVGGVAERQEGVVNVKDELHRVVAVRACPDHVRVREVDGFEAVVLEKAAEGVAPASGSDANPVEGFFEEVDRARCCASFSRRVHVEVASDVVALDKSLRDVQLLDGVVELVCRREQGPNLGRGGCRCVLVRGSITRPLLVAAYCQPSLGARRLLVLQDPHCMHDARVVGDLGDVALCPRASRLEALKLVCDSLLPQGPRRVGAGFLDVFGLVSEMLSCFVGHQGECKGCWSQV